MRAVIFQHVPFEGPGIIGPWLSLRGYSLDFQRWYEDPPTVPAPREIDFLLVLGGPMGVHDVADYPWLTREIDFLGEYLRVSNRPALGICLGAQLLALAAGGQVFPNPVREVGWHRVVPSAHTDAAFNLPQVSTPFHWHGDTFTVPPGGRGLGRSQACESQGFELPNRVVGLQFHLEITPGGIEDLIRECPGDLVVDARHSVQLGHPVQHGQSVQSVAELRSPPPGLIEENHRAIEALLGYLTTSPGARLC